MSRLFLLIVCCLLQQQAYLQTKGKSVSLTISLMKGQPRPKVIPRGQSSDPDIKLVILNTTDTIASFWQTWNIYGDNSIRLEVNIMDSVFNLYFSSFCSTNNYPAANILQPGDSMLVYLKIEECKERGPCPCLYSLPKNYRFPSNNLNGARIRAFYKLDLETHSREIMSSYDIARHMDSVNNSGDKIMKENEKIFKSFVASELISDYIKINFDSW